MRRKRRQVAEACRQLAGLPTPSWNSPSRPRPPGISLLLVGNPKRGKVCQLDLCFLLSAPLPLAVLPPPSLEVTGVLLGFLPLSWPPECDLVLHSH